MDPETRQTHCTALGVLDEGMITMLQGCSEELSQTLSMAVEVCNRVAQGTQVGVHVCLCVRARVHLCVCYVYTYSHVYAGHYNGCHGCKTVR